MSIIPHGIHFVDDDSRVLWLEHNDRNQELHETLDRLITGNRRGEAAAMLLAYIAATASVRATVAGWDDVSGWPYAVNVLAQSNPSDVAIYRVSNMLLELPRTQEEDHGPRDHETDAEHP